MFSDQTPAIQRLRDLKQLGLANRLEHAWLAYRFTILPVCLDGNLGRNCFRGSPWRDAVAVDMRIHAYSTTSWFAVNGRRESELQYPSQITPNPVAIGRWIDDGIASFASRFVVDSFGDSPPATLACTSAPAGSAITEAQFEYRDWQGHHVYQFLPDRLGGTYVFGSYASVDVPDPLPHWSHNSEYQVQAPTCNVPFGQLESELQTVVDAVSQFFSGAQ